MSDATKAHGTSTTVTTAAASRQFGSAVTAIETIRSTLQPNVTFVAVHDSEGNVGLGETFYGASSVEAHIHDVAGPILRTTHSHSPSAVAAALSGYVGYSGSGAEVRAQSAIDIALWDLLAKRAELPLRNLLGGPVRDSIDVYNTCSGNSYVNAESRQSSSNWGIGVGGKPDAPYEDLWAFLNQPGRLAKELLDQGIRGMKVWPFDLVAELSGGSHTTDLSFGLGVLDEIRSSVGDAMDLYVELHSLWLPRGADRLFRELERFDPVWVEDPIRADHSEALSRLRDSTNVPIAVGENLGAGVNGYKRLFDARSVDVAIIDLGWGGGVTQGLKVASLAEQYGIPVAPHDCTGPVSLAVATHFVTAISNGFVQEISRAFYHGWYQEMAEGLPEVAEGRIRPGDSPGHGVTLRPDFLHSPATTVRRFEL